MRTIVMMLITAGGDHLNNVSHSLQNILFVYNKKHYEQFILNSAA
jgi:hypothetical protein